MNAKSPNYQVLRDDYQKALEDLKKYETKNQLDQLPQIGQGQVSEIATEAERPTRPEGHPQQNARPGPPDGQGLEAMADWANRTVRANHAEKMRQQSDPNVTLETKRVDDIEL